MQHDVWTSSDSEGRRLSHCSSCIVVNRNCSPADVRHNHGERSCTLQRDDAECTEPTLPSFITQFRSYSAKVGDSSRPTTACWKNSKRRRRATWRGSRSTTHFKNSSFHWIIDGCKVIKFLGRQEGSIVGITGIVISEFSLKCEHFCRTYQGKPQRNNNAQIVMHHISSK